MKNLKNKVLASLVGVAAALTFGYGTANADLFLMRDSSKIYNYNIVKEDYYGVTVRNKEGNEVYIPNSKLKDYIMTMQDIDEDTANKIEVVKKIEDWGEKNLNLPKSDNFLVYDESFGEYHMVYYCNKLELPKEYVHMKGEFFNNKEEALKRKKGLEDLGYDVFYRSATAQANGSTISKELLKNPITRQVFTILHENMHDYIDFPVDLDEGCANIAGFFGSLEYAEEKFGKDSEAYKNLVDIIDVAYKDDALIIKYYNKLEEVLKSDLSDEEKLKKRDKILDELAEEESKLLGFEVRKSNNPCLASDITYSRFAPLAKKVYEKAGSSKEAIKVMKELSDFARLMPNQNEEELKNFCKTYLEGYVAE